MQPVKDGDAEAQICGDPGNYCGRELLGVAHQCEVPRTRYDADQGHGGVEFCGLARLVHDEQGNLRSAALPEGLCGL
eukprot:9498559-Pyramimonas_sp.AAC.1